MNSGGDVASHPGRQTAIAALFFMAATVILTWPQAIHLDDAITDIWDAKLNARILQWDYHQSLHDPWRLFELNFFHPARDVLAFSENLWGVSVLGWPLLAVGASPLVNYNVLLLLGIFLSAISAWALARYVTGDPLAAVVAGLVYAFVPWRFSQLSHLQHQWGGFLCLLLLFLLRYLDAGRRRDLALFGVCFAWNALANVHYALFSGLVVALVFGFVAIERGGVARGRLFAAGAAALLGGLPFLPFALAYRRAERLYGMRRYLSEMLTYSGRPSYFLSAGIPNRLWGPITAAWRGPEGDFFPGLTAFGLAMVALFAIRRPAESLTAAPSPGRRAVARVLDTLVAGAILLGIAALFVRGLRIAGISIGDPGRVLVWATLLVAARLIVAFPDRSPYRNAGDWLRRSRVPPRVALFTGIGILGMIIALGGHTPYYLFLFQSFGSVFGSIRAPARGIVLFDLALSVLAAWGLAFLLRARARPGRVAWTAVAVLALGVEYRAFPLRLYPVEAKPAPVYAWLADVKPPGAVAELPFGGEYDFDYIFRQAHHGRDLVNGYSGFFPEPYRTLEASFKRRPIPEAVWDRLEELGGRLVIYHSHETRGIAIAAYAIALERAVTAGRFDVVGSFPHEGGVDFVLTDTRDARRGGDAPIAMEHGPARRLFDETSAHVRSKGMRTSPPFGYLDAPREAQVVAPGDWGFGWALDDSGIADVRVETEAGPLPVSAHLPRAELGALYPDYIDSDRAGYTFRVPNLAPGSHRFVVTFVARDGGTTTIERMFTIGGHRAP